ncbi:hypothetical protein J5N97_007743 [Dioscorea zingiberensis]|uniref:Protein kish n=1 Tax=Dioscorea zingiberensis TaxID=325984 RepID=A0A9D5HVW5_9LILI|nr:hypothetical protein J5N97_007743 [Dioscorea zingiberensis]
MSALFNFHSFLTVVLLVICTCSYIKMQFPTILQHRTGFRGFFWKAARIGERLSPWLRLLFPHLREVIMAVVSSEACKDAKSVASSGWDFSCEFEVDYGSDEHAAIVHAALAVDKELQPDKVRRHMSVSDGRLVVHFEAVEARFLRASFSSFVDLVGLATKLIEEFSLPN